MNIDAQHCGYLLDEGGWTLVRHAPGGVNTWHPATDNLVGTEVYGDYTTGPMSRRPWSIDFELAVPVFDEYLFSSGDCTIWLVAKKQDVIGDYTDTGMFLWCPF